MAWKVVIVPLTQFAYSNYHEPAPFEARALNDLTTLIEQGWVIQMSHALETAPESSQMYLWVYLTRSSELPVFGNDWVRRD